jgi:ribosome biogenesis GTPase
MRKARVFKSAKREFECKLIETGEIITATALGNLLKGDENSIVVGDYVMIDDKNTITEVCERKNEIFRLIVREQKKKVTASNCDILVILNSVSNNFEMKVSHSTYDYLSCFFILFINLF